MRGMRMKKLCSLLLALVLLAGCALGESAPEFRRMGDAALLPYLENSLYEQLVSDLDSNDYFVENVQAMYISQEYLDELAFNSQENVYFGYTLSELNAQFQDEKYIFTLGENNETVAVPWTDYDDAYDRVIRNVAIGTGVILVCVTVSVVSAGVGAPAVSMIFAMAAKDGAVGGLLGAASSGVPAFVATAVRTGDMQQAAREAALAGSEGFKLGAIGGSISGGVTEAVGLKGAVHERSGADSARIGLSAGRHQGLPDDGAVRGLPESGACTEDGEWQDGAHLPNRPRFRGRNGANEFDADAAGIGGT